MRIRIKVFPRKPYRATEVDPVIMGKQVINADGTLAIE